MTKYRIHGNTYPIRDYLKLCGCLWSGFIWTTADEKIVDKLRDSWHVSDSILKTIGIEKISEKTIDRELS